MILNGRMFKFSVPTPGDHRSPLRTDGVSCAKSRAINGKLNDKSQFIAPLERMISVPYRTDDIPYGYDICVADDIRYAYVGVAYATK